jgi:hypothetical protein
MYKNRINGLKTGKGCVRPEVWSYILKNKDYSEEEKNNLKMKAAKQAFRMLEFPKDINKYIEDSIFNKYQYGEEKQ